MVKCTWLLSVSIVLVAAAASGTQYLLNFSDVPVAVRYEARVNGGVPADLALPPTTTPGVHHAVMALTPTPGQLLDFDVRAVDGTNTAGGWSNVIQLVAAGTPPATTTPTTTGTQTQTPTQGVGCQPLTGDFTCALAGDAWWLQETMGQRIANGAPRSICAVSVRLYRDGTASGTMHAEIWSDATGTLGARIGNPSMASDIAPSALTTDTNGQTVMFGWANAPQVTGPFWLRIIPDSPGANKVVWLSGGTGACAGGTAYNGWWVNGDMLQDYYYTIFANSGAVATSTVTVPVNTPTATVTASPLSTSTPLATASSTASVTRTWTATPLSTFTVTAVAPSATATRTSTPTQTPSLTWTATATWTSSPTNTPMDTPTATVTATETTVNTATVTATSTATAVPVAFDVTRDGTVTILDAIEYMKRGDEASALCALRVAAELAPCNGLSK